MLLRNKIIPFVIAMVVTGLLLTAVTAQVQAASLTPGKTGKSEVHYLGKSKDGKGWDNPHCSWGNQFKYTVKTSDGLKVAYCMEPGKDFEWWHKYTVRELEKAKAWEKLPESRQRVLAQVLYYGYNTGKSAPYGNTNDYYAATQVLVWEAVDGDISLSDDGKWSKKSNTHDNLITGRKYAEKNYEWIKKKISAHVKGASFTAASSGKAKSYVMKYDYGSGKWGVVLKDTEKGNPLKRHEGTSKSLSITRDGYKYKFSSSSSGTKTAVLVNSTSSGVSQALMIFAPSRAADQTLIFGATDMTKFYVKFTTEKKGTGKIVKTSDDGKVSGFRFKLVCKENGYSKVHTTNSKGLITVGLYPGKYTVTEQLTQAQKKAGYTAASTKTIVVKEGKTSSVKVHNKRAKEDYKIVKTSDNGKVKGFRFVIKDSAGKVVRDAVTDANGFITGKLYPGTYTVSEVLTVAQKEEGYIQPAARKLTLTAGQKGVVQLKFRNRLISDGSILIKKENADGSSPEGFKFEIINQETGETMECVTGEDGTADISGLGLGTYTVKEILTDQQALLFEEPETKTVEVTKDSRTIILEFTNLPKSTPVVLKKTSEDGNVSNIAFSVMGELINGETYGPVEVKTDETGVVQTGELYPGVYTITELRDAGNRYIEQEPQTVTITGEEEEAVTVMFVNELTSLYLTKTDSSTGEFLPGAEFALCDEDENCLMKFRITEEEGKVTIEELENLSDGIVTGESSEDGKYGCIKGLSEGKVYIIRELAAPEGYTAADDIEVVFESGMKLDVKNERQPDAPTVPPSPEEPVTEPPDTTESVTEPAPEETTAPADTVVKTADDRDFAAPAGLLLTAVAVMAGLFLKRKEDEY